MLTTTMHVLNSLTLVIIVYLLYAVLSLLQALTAKLTRLSAAQTDRQITAVPDMLEPGTSFLPTDLEAMHQEEKLQQDSKNRTGLPKSKRTWTKRKG